MDMKILRDRLLGGLWGAVVGDALGVPVEFSYREDLHRSPVTGMIGHGTFDLPAGSWSDDSSLLLCTAESLLGGFDPEDLSRLFIRWYNDGHWTPWGETFDVGSGTAEAIGRLMDGEDPLESGGTGEMDNGNGSLMRILPVALFTSGAPVDVLLERVHAASAVTHRHPRSQIACGLYCLMARRLLDGESLSSAYHQAIGETSRIYAYEPYRRELTHFGRVLSGRISEFNEEEIESNGYVVHTLEAALWSLLTTQTFEETVLRAVNLGRDTDTTASVAGGLAGVYYGFDAIPREWLSAIARREDIEALLEAFVRKVWGFTMVPGSPAGS